MNKWQMSGRTLKWESRGGVGTDDKGKIHYSIHRYGRTETHRMKQRRKNTEKLISD